MRVGLAQELLTFSGLRQIFPDLSCRLHLGYGPSMTPETTEALFFQLQLQLHFPNNFLNFGHTQMACGSCCQAHPSVT